MFVNLCIERDDEDGDDDDDEDEYLGFYEGTGNFGFLKEMPIEALTSTTTYKT